MNVFKDFEKQNQRQAVQTLLNVIKEKGGGRHFERLTVEPPRDSCTMGDISTNAAMVLAKPLAFEPRALAEMIRGQFCR